MRVSLIICTYNRPDYLHNTVVQAMAQTYSDLEIIVVDQTPRNPPQLEAYLAQLSPPRFIYSHLEMPNLPTARNQGLALATGELMIFIDDDVEIEPDFVSKHVEAHRAWEGVWATDKSELPVGGISGADLSPATPTWGVVRARQIKHYGMGVLRWNEAWEAPWLTGCNMAFRRNLLLEVGGFDERMPGGGWGEDVDISLSVRALGYRLVMERGLGLWHHQAQEGGGDHRTKDTERQQRERMTAWLYLIRKHWRTFGHREALRHLWRQYRMYAASLALWQQGGMGLVVRHHAEFLRAWWDLGKRSS